MTNTGNDTDFEQIAPALLDQCYDARNRRTFELGKQVNRWGLATLRDDSYFDGQDFVAEPAYVDETESAIVAEVTVGEAEVAQRDVAEAMDPGAIARLPGISFPRARAPTVPATKAAGRPANPPRASIRGGGSLRS